MSKAQEFLEGGEGGCLNAFVVFSRPVSIFTQLYVKVSLFASCFSSRERTKTNLANLKQKVNIFVLV